MQKLFTYVIGVLLVCGAVSVKAQKQDRIQAIQDKLEQFSATLPQLHDKVQLSVNGVSIQDFLSALSKSSNLSISVDPKLNIRIADNFNNVTAQNVLVFLAKTYNLDISFIGTIISVDPYVDPAQSIIVPKEIKVKYNAPDNTLSVELNNDSLFSVTRKITQLSGKNILVAPALMGKKVTVFIAAAPFDNALEKIAFANEIKLVKTNDNFYLFQALGDGEENYVTGDKNIAVRKNFKPITSTGGGNLGLFVKTNASGQKVISCDATNASILDLVKTASQELGKNYFLYSDIKGTISMHITDVPYDAFMTAIFQGTDYTYRTENGIYMIGDRKLEGLRNNKVVVLQNRSIDTVQAMIPVEWKKGVEIKEFREQNTLLLSGSGPQIAELENYIKQLDQLVPMVMIEVTMVDINKSKTVTTGIKAGIADSVKTGGSVLPGINYTMGSGAINDFLNQLGGVTHLNLGHVAPNFYATINALESHDDIEVHSVPKLTTLNGHTASLSIGSTRYYLVQTQNVLPSITTPTSIFTQQYNKIEANMVINIKPVVSGDDQVTLGIKIDITDFIGTPPANAPAPTSNSKYESIIRAHDGDMLVLGGIERTEEGTSSSGIPLLSRIPIIKWLFSSRSKTNAKIVTLVFIKPTIIH
ncbi:general secretion pathway protein GspD [Mucilaginibacter sp. HMF5004]|uniref:type II secretion system protein GspD n=1 Tax=Mucilaginibacter rivuli TaxID=2857527 RepID=UPI001C5E91C4|nr:general secretion pathway protein GspD [Mucilaginibacter rivuli]MBW4890139.1 general secretion pathway protein GspD [Mucilaginibacter rivuli]